MYFQREITEPGLISSIRFWLDHAYNIFWLTQFSTHTTLIAHKDISDFFFLKDLDSFFLLSHHSIRRIYAVVCSILFFHKHRHTESVPEWCMCTGCSRCLLQSSVWHRRNQDADFSAKPPAVKSSQLWCDWLHPAIIKTHATNTKKLHSHNLRKQRWAAVYCALQKLLTLKPTMSYLICKAQHCW